MTIRLLLFVIALVPCVSRAGEFKLVHRHGEPIADRQAAWNGHVDYASWVDDETIVYGPRSGKVTCLSVNDGKVKWSLDNAAEIQDWSVSRKTKRLAYLGSTNFKYVIVVVDCTNGKKLFQTDSDQLARLLRIDQALPSRLAIAPNDGRLIIGTFPMSYGRNGHVLDPSYQKLQSSFGIDAMPKELSISPAGARIAVIADKDVLCVRDLATDRDVFFRGERITKEPDSISGTVDAPFFSHLRDGGGDTIVYTRDNSWDTGEVFVHNITTKKVKEFDGRNGHIEMDVSFDSHRIALTGTSTDLTLVDFDGKELAHLKGATKQRNVCVEFSPDGERILVGSWDNTLSIFQIVK